MTIRTITHAGPDILPPFTPVPSCDSEPHHPFHHHGLSFTRLMVSADSPTITYQLHAENQQEATELRLIDAHLPDEDAKVTSAMEGTTLTIRVRG